MYGMTDEATLACEDAAQCGGKFLNTLGKTDLSEMTKDEWMSFVATICTEYDESYDRRKEALERSQRAEVQEWVSPEPQKKSGPKTPSWDAPVRNALGGFDDDEIPF